MKSVYVAHPYWHGHPPRRAYNRLMAQTWLCWLARRYHIEPRASWITLTKLWPEEMRELGIAIDREQARRCDVVVLCGDHISAGMEIERKSASAVVNLTVFGSEWPPNLSYADEADVLMHKACIELRHQ